jgi:CRP-like cAMP-binding protein/CheY-like chemotaxis protein
MKKILLIEHNKQVRDNIAEIIRLSNYEVAVAENGKAGIEKAIQLEPDLIICDVLLPLMDGYAVLEAVKKNRRGKAQPFIFISEMRDRQQIRTAMDQGADDYLTKPLEPGDLLAAIEARLKRAATIHVGEHGFNGARVDNGGDWQSFIADGAINRYERKIRIYTEGNHSENLYFVRSGKVLTYKTNEYGRQLVTDILLPGDFLGFVSVLEGTRYKESAEALEDTELAVITKSDFISWADRYPALGIHIMQLLAKNIAARERQLLQVAYGTLREKIASALLFLDLKFRDKNNTAGIYISRETIAGIAGCTLESLVRTLFEFKNEKLINIRSAKLITVDAERMREIFG